MITNASIVLYHPVSFCGCCRLLFATDDMPVEYVHVGRLCATVFPADKNWHRANITGVSPETKQARVQFIDYGGETLVPIKSLKFLDKRFVSLPVQAINARFANVRRPPNGWPKDTVK